MYATLEGAANTLCCRLIVLTRSPALASRASFPFFDCTAGMIADLAQHPITLMLMLKLSHVPASSSMI